MKIRIIELLVKIANGEEVPNKIKFRHSIWEYCKDGSAQDYINDYDKCLMEFLAINKDGLNQYVEIIGEPKKIEKIKQLNNVADCKELIELEDKQQINNHILKDKINELIDEINNLKEK